MNNKSLPASAKEFEDLIKEYLGQNYDVVFDRFLTRKEEAVLVYLDGLTNKDLIDRDIIKPLKAKDFDGNVDKCLKASFVLSNDIDKVVESVLGGNAIVFYEKKEYVFIVEMKKWDKRSIELPQAEGVTRGPKEGFTEDLLTNTAMLRRKLKSTNLVTEKMSLGRQTNTTVVLSYLKDIVNEKILEEIKTRLNKIDIDAILDSGQIEQLIEDNSYSLLSGIGTTQKPDVVAARILEGRVAILVDGSPHVLTIPELFIEAFHTSEDYYARPLYANFIRVMKFLALLVCIFLPGFSVAIMTYSHEMVPFIFLSTFISATENTPFPVWVEILFLAIMFEFLKEAGLRMPKGIGSAITIVGALIIGDTAVTAGLVSAPSVIIISLTSVASLLVVNINEFTTFYRFFFLLLGTIMGLLGIAVGFLIMVCQIISKKSFGIPILSSFSKQERKDDIFRSSLRKIIYRPKSIVGKNKKRLNIKKENSQ